MWSFLAAPKPEPVDPLLEPASLVQRQDERRRCRRCGHCFRPDEEAAMLRPGWCFTCETNWMEKRLQRLIDRLGRKATLAAFRHFSK